MFTISVNLNGTNMNSVTKLLAPAFVVFLSMAGSKFVDLLVQLNLSEYYSKYCLE